MPEPTGFMTYDPATRELRRPAHSYADFLAAIDTTTEAGLLAAASPPPLKLWPAFRLTLPADWVVVRHRPDWGDCVVQLQPDVAAEGGGAVVRSGELWAMPADVAAEQTNHPSGSRWEAYVPERAVKPTTPVKPEPPAAVPCG